MAQSATLAARGMRFLFTSAGAALFAAAGFFINGGPGAPLCFLGRSAALFVTFLDVFRFAFLFVRVAGFAAAGHKKLLFYRIDFDLPLNTSGEPIDSFLL